jgi:competence protein ComEC
LRATGLRLPGGWQPLSGCAQVSLAGKVDGVHTGDEVEIAGLLAVPARPANPGEFDYAAYLRDRGIRATLSTRDTPDALIVLGRGGPRFLSGWLAAIGRWCTQVLDEALPPEQAAVARALLLGDSSAMTGADWDKYLNTGVIHVLAISGQHLVVLGGFLWLVFRLMGVRRRRGGIVVALFLLGYALLVGARPPVMRAAWTVAVLCGGLILRRPVMPANSFALAWLLVAALNPTDIFNTGCQLSFLAVAVLYWGTSAWQHRPIDPLERLIAEGRSFTERLLRHLGGIIFWSYAVNAAVCLAVTPLVASRFHLVSPVALLIGPPMVLLTSIALLAGFLLLILTPIFGPLAFLCARLTEWSLAACELLVDSGSRLPGAFWYVPDVPDWWLWVFYLGLLAGLTLESLRRRWRFALVASLGWLALGLGIDLIPRGPREFRCTFLAVGHGGCTVLETPDGRTLLYDAGAMSGPDVTRKQIAPFLWHRGIRRVDELFLSHADVDHFNGAAALVDRFALGQVTCTPTFADRSTEAAQQTLSVFRQRGIPVRIVRAGDHLDAGPVTIAVLHPPAFGPDGNENARSMVLRVRQGGFSFLLTGDLEGPGLERVLGLPSRPVDVLMAPHHGSRKSNTTDLARWAHPRVVVSCQGRPKSIESPDPYSPMGARFLSTWRHGAVLLRITPEGLVVETFQSAQEWLLPPEREAEIFRPKMVFLLSMSEGKR